MTTLQLLQKDYDDLMNKGTLSESDQALLKKLDAEITFWKEDSARRMSVALRSASNVIHMNVAQAKKESNRISLINLFKGQK